MPEDLVEQLPNTMDRYDAERIEDEPIVSSAPEVPENHDSKAGLIIKKARGRRPDWYPGDGATFDFLDEESGKTTRVNVTGWTTKGELRAENDDEEFWIPAERLSELTSNLELPPDNGDPYIQGLKPQTTEERQARAFLRSLKARGAQALFKGQMGMMKGLEAMPDITRKLNKTRAGTYAAALLVAGVAVAANKMGINARIEEGLNYLPHGAGLGLNGAEDAFHNAENGLQSAAEFGGHTAGSAFHSAEHLGVDGIHRIEHGGEYARHEVGHVADDIADKAEQVGNSGLHRAEDAGNSVYGAGEDAAHSVEHMGEHAANWGEHTAENAFNGARGGGNSALDHVEHAAGYVGDKVESGASYATDKVESGAAYAGHAGGSGLDMAKHTADEALSYTEDGYRHAQDAAAAALGGVESAAHSTEDLAKDVGHHLGIGNDHAQAATDPPGHAMNHAGSGADVGNHHQIHEVVHHHIKPEGTESEKLHAGDTIWYHARDDLAHQLGHQPTNEQVQEATQKILNMNHLTWADARHLPVGYKFEVPTELIKAA